MYSRITRSGSVTPSRSGAGPCPGFWRRWSYTRMPNSTARHQANGHPSTAQDRRGEEAEQQQPDLHPRPLNPIQRPLRGGRAGPHPVL